MHNMEHGGVKQHFTANPNNLGIRDPEQSDVWVCLKMV